MKDKIIIRLRRFGAFLIDMAIISLILLLIFPNESYAGRALGQLLGSLIVSPLYLFIELSFHLYAFIALVIWILYSIVLESIFGYTFGKFVMQLKILTTGKNFGEKLLITSARNILKLLPFNTFSCLLSSSFADRIMACEIIEMHNLKLPKISLNLSFDNFLKMLFIALSFSFLLLLLPNNDEYIIYSNHDIVYFRHAFASLIFAILGYRQYLLKSYNTAIIYTFLLIIYQPFFIIELSVFSPYFDVLTSCILFLTIIDFKGKEKLTNWIKIQNVSNNETTKN